MADTGNPIPAELAIFLSEHFDEDLTGITLDWGPAAEEHLGKGHEAAAFGDKIFLQRPIDVITPEVAGMIGHEVAHVLQHRRGQFRSMAMGALAARLEQEAQDHQQRIQFGYDGSSPAVGQLSISANGDWGPPEQRDRIARVIRMGVDRELKKHHPGGVIRLEEVTIDVPADPTWSDGQILASVLEQVRRVAQSASSAHARPPIVMPPPEALAQYETSDWSEAKLYSENDVRKITGQQTVGKIERVILRFTNQEILNGGDRTDLASNLRDASEWRAKQLTPADVKWLDGQETLSPIEIEVLRYTNDQIISGRANIDPKKNYQAFLDIYKGRVAKDAKKIYDAIKGAGTDEDAIFSVMAGKSRHQMAMLKAAFTAHLRAEGESTEKGNYDSPLQSWLDGDLDRGWYEKAMDAYNSRPLKDDTEYFWASAAAKAWNDFIKDSDAGAKYMIEHGNTLEKGIGYLNQAIFGAAEWTNDQVEYAQKFYIAEMEASESTFIRGLCKTGFVLSSIGGSFGTKALDPTLDYHATEEGMLDLALLIGTFGAGKLVQAGAKTATGLKVLARLSKALDRVAQLSYGLRRMVGLGKSAEKLAQISGKFTKLASTFKGTPRGAKAAEAAAKYQAAAAQARKAETAVQAAKQAEAAAKVAAKSADNAEAAVAKADEAVRLMERAKKEVEALRRLEGAAKKIAVDAGWLSNSLVGRGYDAVSAQLTRDVGMPAVPGWIKNINLKRKLKRGLKEFKNTTTSVKTLARTLSVPDDVLKDYLRYAVSTHPPGSMPPGFTNYKLRQLGFSDEAIDARFTYKPPPPKKNPLDTPEIEKIRGEYQRLGAGAQGEVFKVKDADEVVKILDHVEKAEKEFKLLEELHALGLSQKPLEFKHVSGSLVHGRATIRAEFVAGKTLDDLLMEGVPFRGGFKLGGHDVNIQALLREKLEGLARAGYEMDDAWKAENFILTVKNGQPEVVIIDVGMARKTTRDPEKLLAEMRLLADQYDNAENLRKRLRSRVSLGTMTPEENVAALARHARGEPPGGVGILDEMAGEGVSAANKTMTFKDPLAGYPLNREVLIPRSSGKPTRAVVSGYLPDGRVRLEFVVDGRRAHKHVRPSVLDELNAPKVADVYPIGTNVRVPRTGNSTSEGRVVAHLDDGRIQVEFKVGDQIGSKDLRPEQLHAVNPGLFEGLPAGFEKIVGRQKLEQDLLIPSNSSKPGVQIDYHHPQIKGLVARARMLEERGLSEIDRIRGVQEYTRARLRGTEKQWRAYEARRSAEGVKAISLGDYMDEGLGVCKQNALALQLGLEEAGINSRYVRGYVELPDGSYGGHAWVEVEISGRTYLVDNLWPDWNLKAADEVYQPTWKSKDGLRPLRQENQEALAYRPSTPRPRPNVAAEDPYPVGAQVWVPRTSGPNTPGRVTQHVGEKVRVDFEGGYKVIDRVHLDRANPVQIGELPDDLPPELARLAGQ